MGWNPREMVHRADVDIGAFDGLLGYRGCFELQQNISGASEKIVELGMDSEFHGAG
jgi:hypothetical protein